MNVAFVKFYVCWIDFHVEDKVTIRFEMPIWRNHNDHHVLVNSSFLYISHFGQFIVLHNYNKKPSIVEHFLDCGQTRHLPVSTR